MTIDEIRALINLAAETGIAELEVQRGDDRVRIRRSGFASPQQEVVLAPQVYSTPAQQAAASAAATHAAAIESPKEAEKPADPNLVLVKSPFVGTFYEGPSPGAPPFVRMG